MMDFDEYEGIHWLDAFRECLDKHECALEETAAQIGYPMSDEGRVIKPRLLLAWFSLMENSQDTIARQIMRIGCSGAEYGDHVHEKLCALVKASADELIRKRHAEPYDDGFRG